MEDVTIPTRDDLVKTKRTDPSRDEKNALKQLYSFCCLSKEPLQPPIVACPLGRLYNKESLLSYLINPTPYGHDGHLIASHIRSLKDVITLNLTPNPSLSSSSKEETNLLGTQESRSKSLFIDPISMKEMNGTIKFLIRKKCGCVLSESSLKEMRKLGSGGNVKICPVDGKIDEDGLEGEGEEEWLVVNPRGEELDLLKEEWEARKLKEKEEKKRLKESKKRSTISNPSLEVDPSSSSSSSTTQAAPKKKQKKSKTSTIPAELEPAGISKAGSSVPLLSATLAAKLAESKKTQSAAIASLYSPKDVDLLHDADGRSNWLTMGTYTHYANR